MASRKVRLVILTGSVTAITVMGAWYGAGLKSHQEQAQAVQARRERTVDESVASLEAARGELVRRKLGLERKIRELEMRQLKAKERTQGRVTPT